VIGIGTVTNGKCRYIVIGGLVGTAAGGGWGGGAAGGGGVVPAAFSPSISSRRTVAGANAARVRPDSLRTQRSRS
jgi:hypothetical protein